jgi:hypothetical protein
MRPVLFPAQMRARGVGQWTDGEDCVGVAEAIRGAPRGCEGAGSDTATTASHPVPAPPPARSNSCRCRWCSGIPSSWCSWIPSSSTCSQTFINYWIFHFSTKFLCTMTMKWSISAQIIAYIGGSLSLAFAAITIFEILSWIRSKRVDNRYGEKNWDQFLIFLSSSTENRGACCSVFFSSKSTQLRMKSNGLFSSLVWNTFF